MRPVTDRAKLEDVVSANPVVFTLVNVYLFIVVVDLETFCSDVNSE